MEESKKEISKGITVVFIQTMLVERRVWEEKREESIILHFAQVWNCIEHNMLVGGV